MLRMSLPGYPSTAPVTQIRVRCTRRLMHLFPVVEPAGDAKRDVPVRSPVSLTSSTPLAIPSSSHNLVSHHLIDCKSCVDAGQPCEGYSAEQGRLGSEAADDVPARKEHTIPTSTAPSSKPNIEKQSSLPGLARDGPRRTQLSDSKDPMSSRISRTEKTTKNDRDRLREHDSDDRTLPSILNFGHLESILSLHANH